MPNLATLDIDNLQKGPFELHLIQATNKTKITMKVEANFVSTGSMPETYNILKNSLPSILKSKCFNQKGLPFSSEVLDTELGHLFEHILLEYLTILTHNHQNKKISFSGTTSWDWTKDDLGVFHIRINAGNKYDFIFNEALRLSSKLLNKIIYSRFSKANYNLRATN